MLSTWSIKAELTSDTLHQTGARSHSAPEQPPLGPALHLTELRGLRQTYSTCQLTQSERMKKKSVLSWKLRATPVTGGQDCKTQVYQQITPSLKATRFLSSFPPLYCVVRFQSLAVNSAIVCVVIPK